jgi:hypothetical protein
MVTITLSSSTHNRRPSTPMLEGMGANPLPTCSVWGMTQGVCTTVVSDGYLMGSWYGTVLYLQHGAMVWYMVALRLTYHLNAANNS